MITICSCMNCRVVMKERRGEMRLARSLLWRRIWAGAVRKFGVVNTI